MPTTEIIQLIKGNFIKIDDQEKVQRILEAHNQRLVERLGGWNGELMDILNCHEIDASEIHHGMTYIDSDEAMKLTEKIIGRIKEERK